ncbi:52 kDa repressor of the inhibitor of the protein kinase-like [Ostrea edulis]|uniref:52 kDa repressor of the inhibitor of the protein kinase-like n=1 Tax=Ostrea edulis TaxID=37623 RepID=UPI0024AF46F8|nr:52 kDa repressor of the inhibitor of the protein kinase-like [Ostrea edulis]
MTSEVPSSSLPYKLDQQNQAQYQHTIKLLETIANAIIFCGKQNIPLREHRDDTTSDSSNKGNFLAILQLLAKHDEQLWSHLQKAKKNALYTSKTIQNEVIQLIGNHITGKILKGLQGRVFYSIIADEVTDKYANKEVLVLCLRFLDTREHPAIIKEEFLDFANIGRTTGEAIADKLIEILRLLAIPIDNMRGQAYDGVAAMTSEKRGCQGRIKSLNQLALYTHCRSHVLNLSIASACKLPLVRNMIDVLNSVFIFFDSSPKRQGFLETIVENDGSVDFSRKKLVGLCKTRWVERHICFDVFYTMYKFVIKCLQHILNQNLDESTSENWSWDRQTKVTAQGLLASMTSFSVLITFVFVRYVLDTIKPLTLKPQKRDIDIFTASKLIEEHVDRIKEIRRAVDTELESCFEDAKQIADDLDIVIKTPRVCSKQPHRENVSTSNPRDYHRSVVAIPYLDFFLRIRGFRKKIWWHIQYALCCLSM